jgi:hypothetical protein
MLFWIVTALSLMVPTVAIAVGVVLGRRHERHAWRVINEGLAEVGLSLRVQDVTRTWNANGTFRGVPVTIDGYTEPEGESVATRTALQVLDTPLGQAAIYPVDSPKIADRGAMEELVFDGDFGQKFRVFARSPDTLQRWLTPEVRQVVASFEDIRGGGVQALEIGKDGVLRLVMNWSLLDVTSIRRCCDLVVSIHQGRAPLYADETDRLKGYDSSQWSGLTLGPIMLSLIAAFVSVPALDLPIWRVPAVFGLVYLVVFLFFLWLMRDGEGVRRRVCTLPPEPAGAAHQGYRQRVEMSPSAEATAEVQQSEAQAGEDGAEAQGRRN